MEKDKALDAALSQIERAFGKGSIMRLGQNSHIDIEAISTGSLGIDIALGIGGMQRPHYRNLRPGKLRQNDAGFERHRSGSEKRRHLCLY